MEIKKDFKNENTLKILVTGRLDTNTSSKLQNDISDDLKKYNSIIFDFKELNYISSAGLRLLISTQKKLNKSNKNMVIINVNDILMEIFEISGFVKVLNIK
ncbi:MAG: STAS domain-containing protein [Methanobacteriaceae archaeon]|nr:STAS domain-containing protein [Methanobacteriaceae archaeon]